MARRVGRLLMHRFVLSFTSVVSFLHCCLWVSR
jgi:hypothetical protein